MTERGGVKVVFEQEKKIDPEISVTLLSFRSFLSHSAFAVSFTSSRVSFECAMNDMKMARNDI